MKAKELRGLYNAYHSLDTASAIARILEAKKIKLNIDYTEKCLEILRKKTNNANTHYLTLLNDSLINLQDESKMIAISVPNGEESNIKVNDVIIFTDLSLNKKLKAKIKGINMYDSFYSLYKSNSNILIAHNSKQLDEINYQNKSLKEENENNVSIALKVNVLEIDNK